MSLFLTKMAVDLKPLMDSLPKGYYLHGITFDPKTGYVSVLWETESYQSGYSIPIDFPLEDLKKKRAPKGLLPAQRSKMAFVPKVEPVQFEVPVKQPDYHWTKQQVESALTHGDVFEYQGVEPVWRKVDPDHIFVEGYFYRKVVVDSNVKPELQEVLT